MQQPFSNNISIGKNGSLIASGMAITQKSPLYDRLATPQYLNLRVLASVELFDARFGSDPKFGDLYPRKYAEAIAKAVAEIRAGNSDIKPSAEMNSRILGRIEAWFGTGTQNLWKNRNLEYLALFDAYSLLGAKPVLSIGRNFDLALEAAGGFYAYSDDQAKYRDKKREKLLSAETLVKAFSLAHLLLGHEAEGLAQDGRKDYDARKWKKEMANAINHYEQAWAWWMTKITADRLSDAYARMRQHGKAANLWRKAFEVAPNDAKKAEYAVIWMDFEIYLKDAGRMIAALRAVEAFCASSSQHTLASEKAGELRAALANALES